MFFVHFLPFFFLPLVAFFLGKGFIIKPSSGDGYLRVSGLNSSFSGMMTALAMTAMLCGQLS
jgi:hypothetical protein